MDRNRRKSNKITIEIKREERRGGGSRKREIESEKQEEIDEENERKGEAQGRTFDRARDARVYRNKSTE